MRAATESISRAAWLGVAAALWLGLSTAAHAQPSAAGAATLQFDKGRALMKDKKYAEACAAFEQSQKLDPQLGTLYNLGICYSELGKIASAWNAFREVGQRDTAGNRKQDANRRAKDLAKRLPKLLLTIEDAPPGLVVTMNGVDVTAFIGADSPVDPAEYRLKATAPGHAPWETTAKIANEGKTITIAIELERAGATPKEPRRPERKPPPREPDRPPEGDEANARPPERSVPQTRKRLAFAAVLGGGVALSTGLWLGRLARNKWEEAKALCGDDGVCDNSPMLAQGNALVGEARTRANLSTAFVVGGAVLVGAGVVLWLTAPSGKSSSDTAIRISPQLGPGHAGLTLGGAFR